MSVYRYASENKQAELFFGHKNGGHSQINGSVEQNERARLLFILRTFRNSFNSQYDF